MNKLVITCCASALLTFGATGALAGDIGLAGSTYDWSGGYVGTSVGAALNNTEFNQNYVYTARRTSASKKQTSSTGWTSVILLTMHGSPPAFWRATIGSIRTSSSALRQISTISVSTAP